MKRCLPSRQIVISIIIIVIGMPFLFTGRSLTGVLALWGRIPGSIEGD